LKDGAPTSPTTLGSTLSFASSRPQGLSWSFIPRTWAVNQSQASYKRASYDSLFSITTSPRPRPLSPSRSSDRLNCGIDRPLWTCPSSTVVTDCALGSSHHPNTLDDLETFSLVSGDSYLQSFLDTLHTLCGIGVLALPFALRCAGWSGLLLLAPIAGLHHAAARLIGKIMEFDPSIHSYPDLACLVCGHSGVAAATMAYFTELFLHLLCLVILAADSCGFLFGDSVPHHVYLGLVCLCLLPALLSCGPIRLTVISCIGVCSLVVVIAVVTHQSFGMLRSEQHPLASRSTYVPDSILLSLGCLMFAYSGNTLFPALYRNMSNCSQYAKLVDQTYLLIFVVYVTVSSLGYYLYGDCSLPILSLNLPKGSLPTTIGVCAVLLIPLCKFASVASPLCLALEELPLTFLVSLQPEASPPSLSCAKAISVVVRTSLVSLVYVAALYTASYATILTMKGGLSMILSTTFPLFCYIRLFGTHLSLSWIFFWGLTAATSGLLSLLALYGSLTTTALACVPDNANIPSSL
jgi:vesicular inhibitory amino acid transporter